MCIEKVFLLIDMALKGSYGQLKWSNKRQYPLQLGNLFLWTGTSCYIGLKKKKGKKLVQRNIFMQRRKIMWCLIVFQDLPALKNSGLASLCKGPISLCHRSSSWNTSKYLVSAMKLSWCRQASWQLWNCHETPACPTTRQQVKKKASEFYLPLFATVGILL